MHVYDVILISAQIPERIMRLIAHGSSYNESPFFLSLSLSRRESALHARRVFVVESNAYDLTVFCLGSALTLNENCERQLCDEEIGIFVQTVEHVDDTHSPLDVPRAVSVFLILMLILNIDTAGIFPAI